MQTHLAPDFMHTDAGEEAEAILRSCVHCGFCTATCPTYQLLADELDGPRGRIYQIKGLLEGEPVSPTLRGHLDRCLTCRACESTCPSGVRYSRLLDIGREVAEEALPRPMGEQLARLALRKLVPYPARIAPLITLGRLARPLLPAVLKAKVPPSQAPVTEDAYTTMRSWWVLEGCVQSVATPRTNAAARRLLGRFGIRLDAAPQAGCCGAVSHHLSASEEAHGFMRRNIDAWWPRIEAGKVEGILITASGCGATVKEYGHLLRHDPAYAEKAARISELARDPGELLSELPISRAQFRDQLPLVAFHSPCTLQHGQQLAGVVEAVLQRAGFRLTEVTDSHLCCGSAGTYSLLQPAISEQLRTNKLAALEGPEPEVIATANIGCQLHLGAGTSRPVVHWLELLADYLL